ncbi:DUF1836 domain-containing protein [Amphibacillus sediminis]|uniref:DUF1836 domain-containing protein n=1 Tax=Amphibacillus sediminis TaxID=360185 RepID=UPI00082968D8|nr:DUF1836 domain-containing protein [Amphibacillus sediminis]
MSNLAELLVALHQDTWIELADIPGLDLYMDQVTQLFEQTHQRVKRDENEKVMTKTMINNYVKDKLLFPIKNKKYSKEHIILIQLIYQLKGALSINDIKEMLSTLNARIVNEDIDLAEIYQSYTALLEQQSNDFKQDIVDLAGLINQQLTKQNESDAYIEQLLMVSSLVHYSNMYRKLAERLVDQISEGQQSKEKE